MESCDTGHQHSTDELCGHLKSKQTYISYHVYSSGEAIIHRARRHQQSSPAPAVCFLNSFVLFEIDFAINSIFVTLIQILKLRL